MTCPKVVFGLGGITCGGKTTLAKRLKLTFDDCVTFHQDDYYWPEDHSFWKNDGTDNWDDIASFDMARLIADVRREITLGVSFIILEGVMLYEDKMLDELITHKYFFTLPFDVCKSRRMKRNYIPPEPFPEYFDVVYWPVYLKQLEVAQQRADLCLVDSTKPLDCLEQRLREDATSARVDNCN